MRHCQANVSSFASVTADGAIVQFLLDKREYQVDLANMAEAATALGITSFGIQVCQGLLDYYDSWKGRDSDISSARESVAELSATLVLLEESLKREELDDRRSQRVDESLQGCWSSLKDLSETCQELRQNDEPVGFRQKARSALERSQYHFRKKALVKARETVNEVRESLKLAVQILQLDTSTHSQSILNEVAADARATAERTQHILDAQQSDLFRRITDWLSPADPGTNHASARERYEPETGEWLLQSDQYSAWKDGDIKHLWLYGKPGCGKTILCSSAIEDIRLHCIGAGNFAHASFYFTFSDTDKQSYNSLLRSLVVQLGWKKPSLSMLAETYEKSSRTRPPRDTLEKILLLAIEAFDEVFLLLDALDECPDTDETRQGVLDGLERLMQRTSKLRVLATSREVSDVRECMRVLRADVIAIHTQAVNKDIQTWVLNWLLRDRKLRSLDVATKTLIEETISHKADGM